MFSLDPAFKRVNDRLAKTEPREICERTGADLLSGGVKLLFFEREYLVSLASDTLGSVEPDDLRSDEHLLLLHYLAGLEAELGSGIPEKIEYVSFESLPGGMFYYSTFRKRAPNRLLQAFGDKPDLFASAAGNIDGREAHYGDASAEVQVFPRISMLVIFNFEDEEFPPECQVLFSKSISDHFGLEDSAVLGGILAGRLTAAARKNSS